MQPYIGFKLVNAEPEERNGVPGYAVIYPPVNEGDAPYRSWCPQEAFEKQHYPVSLGEQLSAYIVDDFIESVSYTKLGVKTSAATYKLRNGFEITRTASCVDVANYDDGIGNAIAAERCTDALWELLGFLLETAKHGVKYNEGEFEKISKYAVDE